MQLFLREHNRSVATQKHRAQNWVFGDFVPVSFGYDARDAFTRVFIAMFSGRHACQSHLYIATSLEMDLVSDLLNRTVDPCCFFQLRQDYLTKQCAEIDWIGKESDTLTHCLRSVVFEHATGHIYPCAQRSARVNEHRILTHASVWRTVNTWT